MKLRKIKDIFNAALNRSDVSTLKADKLKEIEITSNFLWEEEAINTDSSDTDTFTPSNNSEPQTGPTTSQPENNTPAPTTNTDDQNLKNVLEDYAKSIDNSFSKFKTENEKIITAEELTANLKDMAGSSNEEIAGIGQAILDVYNTLGIELTTVDDNFSVIKHILDQNSIYTEIVTQAIMRAIKGEEIDPADSNELKAFSVGLQDGITTDDLLALDKDGDGSIVNELKTILSDPEFLKTCQFMLDREKNHVENNKKINALDDSGNNDGEISVGEIAQNFGSNEIADLFKTEEGTVDRALMIALGGDMAKDGNYTINPSVLQNRLYQMDADRDGIVTAEEVAKFKESDIYKQVAYDVMMAEMERSNDKKGNFDGKFCLEDMEKFIKNNPTATTEQKEFFSVITNIKDEKLKKYIMQSLGSGSTTVTLQQFNQTIDSDGDGIVSKEELQAYVDFATQFYNADKVKNTDRLLTKEESKNLEPFKSNPDIWYSFTLKDGCVKMEDVWNYLKTH